MEPEARKNFDKEAAQWDANAGRIRLANDVADAIIREAAPALHMDVLDFGCGTGLVTLRLQPLVKSITGADSSPGMLGVLQEKIQSRGLVNVRTLLTDVESGGHIRGAYHLVASSMTLHHVPDIDALFKQWYDLLLPGGRVCFADLDREDGSFHNDNTGVFHHGFDRQRLTVQLQAAGFHDVRDSTATVMVRDIDGKGKREFPVFLMIGMKK